ncbi:nickel ABC transporter substrate-binding protein [Staphylococcus canis]|uniref:ABC transporter substrate-binding protein n=1 Tax=Staphylococcus canis TaxID=2724942 RepID=A0ABS0T9J4_9STAP|nr:nickel ABC transporter substrate-binding protein [Staphylococcus canis]MBI5974443.1 ABC transporter substrate-binding protein [Staphylococcus canis]
MKSWKFGLVVLTASSALLASCGTQSSQDNVLDVELPLKTTSIAPYETDVPVQAGAMESLFKVNSNGKVEPLLAESYKQVSPQKLEMTIRDNVSFQNGDKLTGEKVKQSLDYALKHGDLVKATLPIQSISADGQKVTIETSEPYPELASELASPFAAIFDTSAKGDVDVQPVGTGPYQIKDYQRSQKIELSRFDDYWQGKPQLEGVNITYQEDGNTRVSHLQSGKADLITNVPVTSVDALEKDDKTKISSVPGYRTQMLIYNHDSKKMTKDVREALDLIIDRESIAKEISKGYAKPATGPFNDTLDFVEEKPVQKQDIAQAKQLIEAAGYSKDKPLKIQLVTYEGRPELPKIAQVLQSDAQKANIDIEIRNVDDIEGYLADRSQWDATMYSFGTIPRGDAGYFFNQAYHPDGAINKGDYHNQNVTAMINRLNQTVDKKEREQLSNEIVNEVQKDVPESYITYNDTIDGLNRNVSNFKATPEGIYLIDYKVGLKDAD